MRVPLAQRALLIHPCRKASIGGSTVRGRSCDEFQSRKSAARLARRPVAGTSVRLSAAVFQSTLRTTDEMR
jgi:hypothetical protein